MSSVESVFSYEASQKINEWRARWQSMTLEECAAFVAILRKGRGPAAAASGKAKEAKATAAANKAPVDTKALLSALQPARAPVQADLIPPVDPDAGGNTADWSIPTDAP